MKTASIAILLVATSTAFAQSPVRVAESEIRAVGEQVSATGTVSSPRTAVLSTAVSGLVERLHVDEGARVERGDPLLELDSEIAEFALVRLRAAVQQRQTDLEDAQRRLAESEKVGPAGGIPQTLIDSIRAEVSVAEAALAGAVAEAREQQARLARHRLTAPFDGVIAQRFSELGEWVNPGTNLFELVATTDLRFDFRLAQRFFNNVSEDTRVDVIVGNDRNVAIAAKVAAIVPVSDAGSRTFLVRLVAENSQQQGLVAPGMSVSAVFSIQTGRSSVTVSRDALIRYADGRRAVWIAAPGDDGTVVRERVVRTGLEFEEFVEIVDGLEAGERVVVEGNESLRDGQAVVILQNGA